MRIHHLNCGSHCPFGGTLLDGRSRGLRARICTHCLLLEMNSHLVLVDTGYGLLDILPGRPSRLPRLWPLILRPRLRQADTAVRQIEALGFAPRDVRHIILTHLDFDHAGGIADFPEARVHLLNAEFDAASRPDKGFIARQRYRPQTWERVVDWRLYRPGGEAWFGFGSVRGLDGLPPEILLVPLQGHTPGHAGVAIQTPRGWLLHAGDSYMHDSQVDIGNGPPALAIYQRIMASDNKARLDNMRRLRQLRSEQGENVTIFASHDQQAYERMKT